jgi:hypothetical protein
VYPVLPAAWDFIFVPVTVWMAFITRGRRLVRSRFAQAASMPIRTLCGISTVLSVCMAE